jgi:hypothetical protein
VGGKQQERRRCEGDPVRVRRAFLVTQESPCEEEPGGQHDRQESVPAAEGDGCPEEAKNAEKRGQHRNIRASVPFVRVSPDEEELPVGKGVLDK